MTINCKGNLIDLSKPKVMGILNVTPDSFFDGGKHNSTDLALKKTEKMLNEGAGFIDIGAYSSRPGAAHISEEEEINRLSVLKEITKRFPEVVVSIDTFRSNVARFAVENGACIVNDISAGNLDKEMFTTVANLQVPYIAMHMQGNPETMQHNPTYAEQGVTIQVVKELSKVVSNLNILGVNDIILDPGFGFGKTVEDNYQILRELDHLNILNCPILVGVSRKSMINKVLKINQKESLNGTTALHMKALENGASILRVHDVKEATQAIQLHAAYYGEFN
jgi:dihydropteroate synthase